MTTVDRKWYDRFGRSILGFVVGLFCIPLAVIVFPFALAYWLAYIDNND